MARNERVKYTMAVETKREGEVFRIVAGVIMVAAILFGVLELTDVIRI